MPHQFVCAIAADANRQKPNSRMKKRNITATFPKVLQTLGNLRHMLVEGAGTPISKDRLIESAWPGLSIEESNLTVQIAALRRTFAEEYGGENWIETLPRRGYRYVGPVVAKEQQSEGVAANAQPAP